MRFAIFSATKQPTKPCIRKARMLVRAHLNTVYMDIGISGAAEAIFHVTRQWQLQRRQYNLQKVVLTVNIANAFNSADRSAILNAARRFMPSCVPWLDFCYSGPSHLVMQSHRLLLSAQSSKKKSFGAFHIRSRPSRFDFESSTTCRGGPSSQP